jgi:hypothetical protein
MTTWTKRGAPRTRILDTTWRGSLGIEKAPNAPSFLALMPLPSHYTGRAGLEGIARSKTFWATDFQVLNDKTVICCMRSDKRSTAVLAALGTSVFSGPVARLLFLRRRDVGEPPVEFG